MTKIKFFKYAKSQGHKVIWEGGGHQQKDLALRITRV